MDSMEFLKGKKILLGVTGGIAAYKTVSLLRLFKKAGASVQVVGTNNSLNFVGASTWKALSGKEALFETFQSFDTSKIPHITFAQDVEAIVIAPATANIIAKCANGICDDLLSSILVARKVPVLFAPGMNTAMYENPSTQRNIDFLKSLDGVHFIDPEEGELACNTAGKGRMAEPDEIFKAIEKLFGSRNGYGLRWLVSGGATREYIDPIRFVTNGSLGKTGHYIACEAAREGGDVTFIGANVSIVKDGYEKVSVTTAENMYDAVMNRINDCDILVMSAAVADFTPVKEEQKIKKGEGSLEIRFDRTKDILKSTIDVSDPKMVRIGFAAETGDLEKNAVRKMREKKLDMVVANLVSEKNDPFGSDTNSVKLITPEKVEIFEDLTKKALSRLIVKRAINLYRVKNEV